MARYGLAEQTPTRVIERSRAPSKALTFASWSLPHDVLVPDRASTTS